MRIQEFFRGYYFMANRRIAVIVALFIVLGAGYLILQRYNTHRLNTASDATKEFDQNVLQSNDTVLVYFWAPWCSSCKKTSPVIQQISDEYAGKISIYKVNVENNQALTTQYQVQNIPTFIIFKQGRILDRMSGFSSKETITKWIDKTIAGN
jgi:thioredoxin 1